MLAVALPAALWMFASTAGEAETKVTPGRFLIDPPTVENLGFRWYIEGDSNRNASVIVEYRGKGAGAWKQAQPMLRIHNEVVNQAFQPYRTGNLFAGSILFLEPATEYEARFTMRDPDGGAPPPMTVTAATRAEPPVHTGGRTILVKPGGLAEAYAAAQPGDIFVLRGGIHKFTAPLELTRSGEPGRPIVFRGAGDAEPILEGPDHKTDLLRIGQASHLTFENLTFRRARIALHGGEKGKPGSSHLTVRRCRIENVVYGIRTTSEESEGWLLTDNVITGINPQWFPRPTDGKYMEPAHTGVNVYGRGHVVRHNRISRFSDGIALANFGPPPAAPERQPAAIDIHNNDLSGAQDDAIETDYGAHNVRVYRNRLNNAHTGISVQPFYGGPVYLVRNELYSITTLTFKWHNYCAGILAYHNTLACSGSGFRSFDRWQNGHLRNNLILGGAGPAMTTGSISPYSTLDYNGYRDNGAETLIRWFDGTREAFYKTLSEFSKATGHERHGRMIDYDVFVHASAPLAGRSYEVGEWDLRLKPGAAAVDAGIELPNINDGFRAKAPDLGFLELGERAPHYGPR